MMDNQTPRWMSVVICLASAICFSASCTAQPRAFERVLRNPVIGKTVYQYFPRNKVDTYRRFLGTITDRRGRIIYYVVAERALVQAAIVKHGHQGLLFFDRHKRPRFVYDDCNQLPIALRNNTLYWSFTNEAGQRVREHARLTATLPEVLSESQFGFTPHEDWIELQW